MDRTVTVSHSGSFAHVLQTFAISLLVSFLGTLVGAMVVPPSMIMLFVIAEVAMLVAAIVIRIRGKNIGYGFLYAFTAISGVTLYPVIMAYGGMLGANVVSGAFFATAAIFGGLAFYAHRSQRDFSFLGGFLFAGTIGLVLMSVIGMFVNFDSMTNLIWSMLGILIFSGWVLYDVAQYRNGVSAEEVPLAALNIYLDFINLFLYILRFLASIVGVSRD
ncbi:Bax inhibitor-1/YccA family protein [Paenibacillus chondroitinus]|uniref:Bax inhibitor-1/YccA family protein n=1 Tax=Paenibacillus chondroitinus TaxID=59842 RepID=A0ABU6DBT5_9BACL|nr:MULTISPECIES: Bax inhibitor-1/YccA family protein [Paenibacillus]MCY9656396.1 Bax inhibitor-1/YccA family protein [Paenibacillus anseongense]MEB4795220.1 Bax inhibitor-1/YccA family protein [Paenibacillus chondroitinus]